MLRNAPEADYSLPGLGGGIQIARTWNSQWESVNPVERSGTFGNSWRSTYDERLVIPTGTTGPRTIQYWLSDGSEWTFQTTPSGSAYTVVSPLDEHATLQADITQTSYTMTFVDGTRKAFNNSGYLTAITDRNGNKTAINYDAANRITNVTDAAGRVLTFNYGPARQAQSIQDAVGVVATYSYDSGARLTKVVYADGSSVNMTYDSADLLLSVTDSNGKILEAHTFDSLRRGLTSTRANGVDSVTLRYTAQGQTEVVSSQNVVTTYGSGTFGGRSSVASVNGPGCSSCGGRSNTSFSYDASGNRTSRKDALGRTTTYSYDSVGNVLSTSIQGITSSYTYNAFGEVLTATDPMGNKTTNTYDPNGNLLTVTSPAPASGVAASMTKFAYDAKGD